MQKTNSPVFAASYREPLDATSQISRSASQHFPPFCRVHRQDGGSRWSEFRLQSADESDDPISVFLSVTEGGCGQIKRADLCFNTAALTTLFLLLRRLLLLQQLKSPPQFSVWLVFQSCVQIGLFFYLGCRCSSARDLSNSGEELQVAPSSAAVHKQRLNVSQ